MSAARSAPQDQPGEFEFLRGIPFGPYLPVDSPLHRLDPRARILLGVIFVAALTAAGRPAGLFLGVLVSLAAYKIARAPFGPLLRGWRSALPFLLFLAGLQILLSSGGAGEPVLVRVGPLDWSATDLWAGVMLLLRFTALMIVLSLALATLSESELTRGLEALLSPLAAVRVPIYDFITAVQVMLRYFPLLAQVAERIAKAQAARGADWRPAGGNFLQRARQMAPVIVPLFVSSLRRAENMALAMDARGYGSLPRRTSMVALRFRPVDFLAVCAALALAGAILFL
jgi:energy-coupling factor transport system permease protein